MATSGKLSSEDSLAERLRARIEREGPITFCEWMSAALYDDRDGYYCRADRIQQGRTGDYRTAPETSPLFAATFAFYFSKLFADLKWPPSFTLFESGAGNGEFAQGVLQSLKTNAPEVFEVTHYVIDEISPAARHRAAARLSKFADRVSFQSFKDINSPAAAGVVFSNELIDAFPVHRVIGREGGLRELFVGVDEKNFVWSERDLDEDVAEYCRRDGLELAEGQIAEINLEAERFIMRAAGLVERGYVITVDYGAERNELRNAPNRQSGTLRAFHRHQMLQDVLAAPGDQDLTTTIDWTQLMEAGERAGLRTLRLERLDQFLGGEGLLSLLGDMANSARDSVDVVQLSLSARELILPTGMAASFQVLLQEKVARG